MFNPVRILTVARKGGAIALVSAAAIALTVVFQAEAGEAGSWVVELADGAVTIDGQAAAGAALTVGPGALIETGADGNVVLTRPGDSITVFPNSKMSVPVSGNGGEPGILQTFGKLLFRMESRESRDFEVETPYLAAAIKGTTFTVEVDENAAVVEVSEGSVLVTASRGGESAFVGAGRRASVGGRSGKSVQISESSDDDGKKSEPDEADESDKAKESTESEKSDKSDNGDSSDSTDSRDNGDDGNDDGNDSGNDDGNDSGNDSATTTATTTATTAATTTA